MKTVREFERAICAGSPRIGVVEFDLAVDGVGQEMEFLSPVSLPRSARCALLPPNSDWLRGPLGVVTGMQGGDLFRAGGCWKRAVDRDLGDGSLGN